MLIFLLLLLLLLNEHEFPLGGINKGTSLCLSFSISSSMLRDYRMCIRVPTCQKLFSCIAEDLLFFFCFTVFHICSIHSVYCLLTVRTFLPSSSMAQGHQPLTHFWAKSDLERPLLFLSWINMSRRHFSAVLVGGIRLIKSNSTVPVWEIQRAQFHNSSYPF